MNISLLTENDDIPNFLREKFTFRNFLVQKWVRPKKRRQSSTKKDSTENTQPGPADIQPDINTTETATENTPPDAYYKFFFK